jgi:hypothetical protein
LVRLGKHVNSVVTTVKSIVLVVPEKSILVTSISVGCFPANFDFVFTDALASRSIN